MSKKPEVMSQAAATDLIETLKKKWIKCRSCPHKAPDEIVIEMCLIRQFLAGKRIKIVDQGTGQVSVSAYGHGKTYECRKFLVAAKNSTEKSLEFLYCGNDGLYKGANYGLVVLDRDSNVIYWREVGQNPRTEWLINCLAEYLEDENGKFVFVGEPVTI